MAKQQQNSNRSTVALPPLAVVTALVCACAWALELTAFASAQDFHCSTDANSPTLDDTIDAVSTVINQARCCQSNEWLLGSGCHTFGSVGTASIGICDDDHIHKYCINCDFARALLYDLIDQCADNSYGETRVKGDVLHVDRDVPGSGGTLALILFSS